MALEGFFLHFFGFTVGGGIDQRADTSQGANEQGLMGESARGQTSQEANQPDTSQGADRPWGESAMSETAKGRKSQIHF